MRLVGIPSLSEGDTLAVPVYTTSGKSILNSGVTLNQAYIQKLKQLGISKVYINDGRFDDVEVVQHLDIKTRINAVNTVRGAYEQLQKAREIDEYGLKDLSKEIVEFVRDCRDKGVSLLSTDAVDDYIIPHSINVGIISAFLGNKMSYTYTQICDLVIGALIHDLGRENSGKELPEHAQKGFDAMRKCRGLSLHSSIVCYEHHENFNGTGYPRKLKGTAISEFSRIIRVADMYDNCLHGYENRNQQAMPHQAFEYVLALAGSALDPDIVQKFRDTVVFYPNGCTVLLSNGLRGVIVKQNQGSPQRPVIRVYNEVTVIGEIDLLKSLTLTIKDVLVT